MYLYTRTMKLVKQVLWASKIRLYRLDPEMKLHNMKYIYIILQILNSQIVRVSITGQWTLLANSGLMIIKPTESFHL